MPQSQRDTSRSADDAPAVPTASRWRWLSEELLLKTVFRLLMIAAAVFLAIDYTAIQKEANAPLPGRVEERTSVVMQPPKPRDHVRPYLPRATPTRRRGGNPNLPGYAKPVPHKQVGQRMTFVRGPKGAVSAVGRIEPGSGAEFAQFIESQAGEIKSLYLHSPGGSVRDALSMSKLLRETGIATVVPDNGYCASSCPIVFSGGKQRTAGKGAWIGVHQIYAASSSPGDLADGMAHAQRISGEVQEHLAKMGVDVEAWIHAMKTPSDQLYIFTPKELTTYRLATQIAKS